MRVQQASHLCGALSLRISVSGCYCIHTKKLNLGEVTYLSMVLITTTHTKDSLEVYIQMLGKKEIFAYRSTVKSLDWVKVLNVYCFRDIAKSCFPEGVSYTMIFVFFQKSVFEDEKGVFWGQSDPFPGDFQDSAICFPLFEDFSYLLFNSLVQYSLYFTFP